MTAPRVLIYVNPAKRVDPTHTSQLFASLIRERVPEARIETAADEEEARARIGNAEILYGWGFGGELLAAGTQLRWIEKTGAGVEDIMAHAALLNPGVQVTRIDGRILAPRMAEYVLAALYGASTGMFRAAERQLSKQWLPYELPLAAGRTIGIAGVGDIGGYIGERLAQNEFRVIGWRRGAGSAPGFERIYAGTAQLPQFLEECQGLILLLPLTDETRGIITAEALARLPRGAVIVNIGRGPVLDETALLDALASGHVGHAILDVFAAEPLPSQHPYWTAPRLLITPHVAGPMIPADVVPHFGDNYRRFMAGEPLRDVIDLNLGY